MIHGIWTFLSDNTVCGKPIEKERGNLKNIALELEDITCPECHHKLEVARATA